jgi:hypothetical protein
MTRENQPLLRRLRPELFVEQDRPTTATGARLPAWVERAKARTLTAKDMTGR